MKFNCKTEFYFILDLYFSGQNNGAPKFTEFPTFDFTGVLYTTNRKATYTFSKVGDALTNCYNDGGHIHVIVNNHEMRPGLLTCELTLFFQDNKYTDGIRSVVHTIPLSIKLTDAESDQVTPTVSVRLPIFRVNENGRVMKIWISNSVPSVSSFSTSYDYLLISAVPAMNSSAQPGTVWRCVDGTWTKVNNPAIYVVG